MSQQPDPNQRLNIDNASIQDSQIGQAGGDLTQIQGQVVHVTVYNNVNDLSDRLGKKGSNTSKPLNQQEYRQRKVLLNKVKKFWIEGVLERSLYTKVLIELGLEERLDAVKRPFSSVQESPDEPGQALPVGTDITQVFNQMGEGKTLLILGEPGAGKTTILLKILQDLIVYTEENLSQPIPVVFNLSSWASKRQTIADWLVQELQIQYQVSKKLGKAWVEEQQLLLLLDGLDEVKAEHRQSCVQAINQFMQAHGQTEIVVCSRIKDYEVLSTRLQLQGAIYIQPLTLEQINHYLEQAGNQLEAVKTLLKQDTLLQELAKSPLMLSIVSLTCQGVSVENLTQAGSIEERRQHLFTKYVERMFKRPGADLQYPKAKVMRCLIWLAQNMYQEPQTIFSIERMQPTWLKTSTQKLMYRVSVGLSGGLIFGSIGLMGFGSINGLLLGVIILLSTVVGGANEAIETVETLEWSWLKIKVAVIIGIIITPISGLITALLFSVPKHGLINGLIAGQIGTPIYFLLFVLLLSPIIGATKLREEKKIPNQGIWRSVVNAGIFSLLLGLSLGLIFSLLLGLNLGLKFGLAGCLSGGLLGGGDACVKHFILRLILCRNGFIPWNYAHFLDYATGRIFLQKVGGGYIFIHRMLLEHFAQMELDQVKH